MCHDARAQLSFLVDDAVLPAERAALDVHLAGCPECQRELERLRATVGLLGRLGPVRAPAGFVDRVMAAVYPTPWHRRLRDVLFVPLRRKLPLEALAMVVVAGTAVYVYQRTPEVRQLAQQEGRETAAPASTRAAPAAGLASAPVSGAAATPQSSAPIVPEGDGSVPLGLRARQEASKAGPGAPSSAGSAGALPRAGEPSRSGELKSGQLKKERAAGVRQDGSVPAPPRGASAPRETKTDQAAARDTGTGASTSSSSAAGAASAAGGAVPPAPVSSPAPAESGNAVTVAPPVAPPLPAVAGTPPPGPARVLSAAKPEAVPESASHDARQAPAVRAETPGAPGSATPSLSAPGFAAKSGAGVADAGRDAATGSTLAARPRASARLLRAVDASGRLVVTAPAAAETALDGLVARLGGVRVARRLEGGAGPLLVELLIPVARYPELAAGLARIGQWTPEHEVGTLPPQVRVEVAITTEP